MTALFSSPPEQQAPPPPPAAPPPPPMPVDQAVSKAGSDLAKRAKGASGLASTNPTGPQGLVAPADTTKNELKSMLGA